MIDEDTEVESVYDREDQTEDELWFLPGEPEDRAPTDLPWPLANRAALFEAQTWQRAEGRQGRGLADAASAFARLDERLRGFESGVSHGLAERLVLLEVADLLWAQGDRIPMERIALYRHARESTLANAQVLSSADWALRRMAAHLQPTGGLYAFLGRQKVEEDGLAEISTRAVGAGFEGAEADWVGVLEQMRNAHPITQAAAAYHAWRIFGLSAPADVLEAAVAAGKIGAKGAKALGFLPVAMGDRYALGQGGTPAELLSSWYKGVENACLRGLMQLDQLEYWRARAVRETADLSGKTPPLLIEAFVQSPLVSAEMAATITGVSKAAVQRNLSKFAHRGLIREITGQGRYQFWMVA
ncbi:hypothetical protein A9Q96_09705 [Rhodobacterales bacterium 52_120_T64]|nr:hypothetical protein A9Q96_09705 [Rhodobacterales bacterium 52_120_T64]